MNEHLDELAALHALRLLSPAEEAEFQHALAADETLRARLAEYEGTAAQLAHLAPAVRPPAELKQRLFAQLRQPAVVTPMTQTAVPSKRYSWLAWAALLPLAGIIVTQYWQGAQLQQRLVTAAAEKTQLEQQVSQFKSGQETLLAQVGQLRGDLQQLRRQDALAQMKIATLQSTVSAYQQGVAVVVWDADKQSGMLKLEKMPPVETGKDYQLWVVDSKQPSPISAGVVRVDAQGFATVEFKPVEAIRDASKFALSVEREGGAAQNQGPIILLSP
jgi:anti-sigma-K factor RskA